jgi:hypothetical protein
VVDEVNDHERFTIGGRIVDQAAEELGVGRVGDRIVGVVVGGYLAVCIGVEPSTSGL